MPNFAPPAKAMEPKVPASALERKVRRAVASERIMLHYQPQISVASGRIAGVEALLRWRKKDGSAVASRKLIRVAEQSGQIRDIGEWVLAAACRQAAEWHKSGDVIRMAVNVSPRQLEDFGMVSRFLRIVESAGLAPSDVELELTEGCTLARATPAISNLQDLHDAGFPVAIDDFGSGFATLCRAATIPADRVKLPACVLHALCSRPRALQLMRDLVSLAHNLDLRITAEGIETLDQLHLVQDAGCDEWQGFLYSRPTPADRLLLRG